MSIEMKHAKKEMVKLNRIEKKIDILNKRDISVHKKLK